jgi:hypothetical protein
MRRAKLLAFLGLCIFALGALAAAQLASLSQFAVGTTTLQQVQLRQPYQFELQTQSGVPPFKWTITKGSLPPGLAMSDNGVISGVATEKGEYPFVVTVTDNTSRKAQTATQAFVLRVVAPLLAEWSRPPKVTGNKIEGGIRVSNQTGRDFDLTVIVLAINEIGRATAICYQHLTMKKDAADLDIPCEETLPRGAYDVDGTVVAEVIETNTIHKVRLVAGQKLQVAVGP